MQANESKRETNEGNFILFYFFGRERNVKFEKFHYYSDLQRCGKGKQSCTFRNVRHILGSTR